MESEEEIAEINLIDKIVFFVVFFFCLFFPMCTFVGNASDHFQSEMLLVCFHWNLHSDRDYKAPVMLTRREV